MPAREALIIASAHYSDIVLQQLQAPADDAHSLTEVLSHPDIGNFQVRELIDQPSYEVSVAIEEFFANRQPDDLVLLYFSGHGIKDEDGRLFFATTNTKRSRLLSSAVPATMVNEAMVRSRSRRQLLILDCCFSGAFARGMFAKSDGSVGTIDHFQGTGRIVLTASDATQYAMEADAVTGQGMRSIFTETIVEGLKTGAADTNFDGLISLDDLYEYTLDRVSARTPAQRPMKWVLGATGEIVIARNNRPVAQPAELPANLIDAIENSIFPGVRQGAVRELGKLLRGRNRALALAAELKLQELVNDDSRTTSELATSLLADSRKAREAGAETTNLPLTDTPQRPARAPVESRPEATSTEPTETTTKENALAPSRLTGGGTEQRSTQAAETVEKLLVEEPVAAKPVQGVPDGEIRVMEPITFRNLAQPPPDAPSLTARAAASIGLDVPDARPETLAKAASADVDISVPPVSKAKIEERGVQPRAAVAATAPADLPTPKPDGNEVVAPKARWLMPPAVAGAPRVSSYAMIGGAVVLALLIALFTVSFHHLFPGREEGKKLAAQTPEASTAVQQPSPPPDTAKGEKAPALAAQPHQLVNISNIAAVTSGPTKPTLIEVDPPGWNLNEIITYHWNDGHGKAPGTIALRAQDGTMRGPFQAIGQAGQGGAPNVNWVATLDLYLPPGVYTVIDSDSSTWSQNAQSGNQGFAILSGTTLSETGQTRPPEQKPPEEKTGNTAKIVRPKPEPNTPPAKNTADRVQVPASELQSLLISEVQPIYPSLAQQAHVQGLVVLRAVIGKQGTVQSLQLVKGHPLLVNASMDAVKQWRYRPYYLNGRPVEVDTTINVNFSLHPKT